MDRLRSCLVASEQPVLRRGALRSDYVVSPKRKRGRTNPRWHVGLRFRNAGQCYYADSVNRHASERAAMPGRALPSRSSSDAPPPVEQWVTLSSACHLTAAVAVSPPPIT